MLGTVFTTVALAAVGYVAWTRPPGPLLRRVARLVGLLLLGAFVGSLLPTGKSNSASMLAVAAAWYAGLAFTRWRRERRGNWPASTPAWPWWFILSGAYLVYDALGALLVSRNDHAAFALVGIALYVVVGLVLVARARGWELWSTEGRRRVSANAEHQLQQMRQFSDSAEKAPGHQGDPDRS